MIFFPLLYISTKAKEKTVYWSLATVDSNVHIEQYPPSRTKLGLVKSTVIEGS